MSYRFNPLFCVLCLSFVLFGVGCGDNDTKDSNNNEPLIIGDMTDMTGDLADDMEDMSQDEQAGCGESNIAFRLYADNDRSSLTTFGQRVMDPDEPIAQASVKLIGPQKRVEGKTCDDGTISWSTLPDGAYITEIDVASTQYITSSNQSRRLPKAIAEGNVNLLTFGDSIPAYGPKPWFPAKLTDRLLPMVQVNNNNVAVPGSQSIEWLPDTRYYKNKLQPSLASADVIVFSLGGNDLYDFANSLGGITQDKINEKYAEFQTLVDQIKINLKTIVAAIREVNAEADIVWILYPNYAQSSYWEDIAGSSISLVQNLLQRTLGEVRRDIGKEEDLLIVDMFNMLYKKDIDQYLIDPLHLNQPGHELYADEVFKTLGGVIIKDGQNVDSTPRYIGVGTKQ